jgi:uncharacterized protein
MMGSLNDFNYSLTLFFSLLVSTIPSLFLGVTFSSYLLLWLESADNQQRLSISPWNGVFLGILGGLLSPIGQYGHFPIVRRLFLEKVPTTVAIAFFLASPTINLGNLWATYQVFATRSSIIWWRVGITLMITLLISLIFSTVERKTKYDQKNNSETCFDPLLIQSGTILSVLEKKLALKRKLPRTVSLFINNLLKEFWEFGTVLILGCLVTTITLVAIQQRDFLVVANEPIASIVRSMLYGFVLSLGATATTSFVATLGAIVTKGGIISFLVFSSFVDLKSIGLLLLVFRAKAAVYLLVLLVMLTFLFSLIVDYYFG